MSKEEDASGPIEIPAGQVPVPVNQAWDAPTICADGIHGMAGSTHQVRIQLVEHFIGEEKLVSRFVGNLVFDKEQFIKFAASVQSLASAINASSGEKAD